MECLDYSKLTNQLNDSQYEGAIALLPKFSASNYRPITSLKCDYKIISKVISNRIDPFLNDLIEKEQNESQKHWRQYSFTI